MFVLEYKIHLDIYHNQLILQVLSEKSVHEFDFQRMSFLIHANIFNVQNTLMNMN